MLQEVFQNFVTRICLQRRHALFVAALQLVGRSMGWSLVSVPNQIYAGVSGPVESKFPVAWIEFGSQQNAACILLKNLQNKLLHLHLSLSLSLSLSLVWSFPFLCVWTKLWFPSEIQRPWEEIPFRKNHSWSKKKLTIEQCMSKNISPNL